MKTERIFYSFILVILFSVILINIRTRTTIQFLFHTEEQNRYWIVKTHFKQDVNVILLGDSRVYLGISPDVMSQTLGKVNILNFAYRSGGLNKYMYEEAYSRLNPKSCLRVIILGISPHELTPSAAANTHYIQEKTRSSDYIISNYFLYNLESYLSPINPNMLKSYINYRYFHTKDGYYIEYFDDGWMAAWRIPQTISAITNYTDIFNTTKVSRELIQQLMDQTDDWTKNGILVFAFRTPTHPDMISLENRMSGFNEKNFAEEFQQHGGIWLDFSDKVYNSYDGSHLEKSAAIQLSKDLANKLSKYLANSCK